MPYEPRAFETTAHECRCGLSDELVDQGAMVGGFARFYEARLVRDADTPIIRSIARATGLELNRTVTVDGQLPNATSWRREFTADILVGIEYADCVFSTPNANVVGIRVQGIVFLVNVTRPDRAERLNITPVTAGTSDPTQGRMFFASFTDVAAFDGSRILWWSSERVSDDGVSELSYANGRVRGFARDFSSNRYARPFTIDADTGKVLRGVW